MNQEGGSAGSEPRLLFSGEQAAQSQLAGWQGAPEASMSAPTESLEPGRDCGMEGLWCEGTMV